jgi:hypothetical protein
MTSTNSTAATARPSAPTSAQNMTTTTDEPKFDLYTKKVYGQVCEILKSHPLSRVFFYNTKWLGPDCAVVVVDHESLAAFKDNVIWDRTYRREVLRETKSGHVLCVIAVDDDGEVVRTNVYSIAAFVKFFRRAEHADDIAAIATTAAAAAKTPVAAAGDDEMSDTTSTTTATTMSAQSSVESSPMLPSMASAFLLQRESITV